MPVDPFIARGTLGMDVSDTLARIAALKQRDRYVAADEQKNVLWAQQQQAALQQRAQAQTQDDEEDERFEAARLAGDWDTMASIDPQTTKLLWEFQQARQPAQDFSERPGPYGTKIVVGPDKRWQMVQPPKVAESPAMPAEASSEVLAEDPKVALAREKARATAQGRVQGETQAKATADLPRVRDNAEQMLGTLEALEDSPGFEMLWGPYALMPVIPGTKQADAFAIWEQIQGKAFLEAFNTLKGGGQITEKEGEKATAAITRLAQRRQSAKSAKEAVRELRGVVRSAVERAWNQTQGETPSRRKFNPETGKIE